MEVLERRPLVVVGPEDERDVIRGVGAPQHVHVILALGGGERVREGSTPRQHAHVGVCCSVAVHICRRHKSVFETLVKMQPSLIGFLKLVRLTIVNVCRMILSNAVLEQTDGQTFDDTTKICLCLKRPTNHITLGYLTY